jgi:hypothetical protein
MMLTLSRYNTLISVVVQPCFHHQPAVTQIPSIFVWKKVERHQGGPKPEDSLPWVSFSYVLTYKVPPASLFDFRDLGTRGSAKDPSSLSVWRFHLALAHVHNLEGEKAKCSLMTLLFRPVYHLLIGTRTSRTTKRLFSSPQALPLVSQVSCGVAFESRSMS